MSWWDVKQYSTNQPDTYRYMDIIDSDVIDDNDNEMLNSNGNYFLWKKKNITLN